MRYFSELSYNGANYSGWQKQPSASTVQETIERAFSTILNSGLEVVGCGRTDTGVHARQYFMHFDFDGPIPKAFVGRVNRLLPTDIAIRRIFPVAENAHARFDAILRSYEYHIVFDKNPFETQAAWHFPFFEKLDFEKVGQAASLLMEYEGFFPFCKTHTDAKTMKCQLSRSEWVLDASARRMVYHISANRFLRGMVRLIVGMCFNVGLGKVGMDEVRQTMDKQTIMKKSWSVPPDGLFLTAIKYS